MSEAAPKSAAPLAGYSLRFLLILLAVSGLLPLALASGIGLYLLDRHQHEQTRRLGIDSARALNTAVDAELQRTVSVLQVLASSTALANADLDDFYDQAQRVIAAQPGWLLIAVASPNGEQVLNTRVAKGQKPPDVVEPDSLAELVRNRAPVIGSLQRGRGGNYALAVRVPVMNGGTLRYALSGAIKPDAFLEVVRRQKVPDDWVISIFDRRNIRVARSRAQERSLGSTATPGLQQMILNANEGWDLTRTIEGESVYTAFSRSPQTGWTVAVGIPQQVVREGAMRTLAAYGSGLVMSLGLGLIVVVAIAAKIAVPIASLRAAAHTLARREIPVVAPTRVVEIREVADALVTAGEERARIELHREQLLRSEQEARATAERASRSKDEFVSMLSHELRNPIGAIANAARLLERDNVEAGVALRARQVIRRQSAHLGRLTDDLLAAEAALQGRSVLQRRSIDLAAAVRDAIDIAAAGERDGKHRVTSELTPVWINADALRLQQIVTRLLDNALKYTPAGGLVHITTRAEGGDGVLTVADTGIGMTAELTARVFDLFAQGERAPHRPEGGLGIGLTLVRRLAEMHGGTASARSAGPGAGSEFEVRLPRATIPEEAPAQQQQRATAPRDVLLVEDNDDARTTMCMLLEAAGHRVRTAADGVEGLHAALTNPPDIALVDIGLPRLDGYEVARRIREATATGARPLLVAVTGYGLPADRDRAMAAGFDAHLVKPVDRQALESVLARL